MKMKTEVVSMSTEHITQQHLSRAGGRHSFIAESGCALHDGQVPERAAQVATAAAANRASVSVGKPQDALAPYT